MAEENNASEAARPVPQSIRNLHIKAKAALERNPDLAIDMLMRCVVSCPSFTDARIDLRHPVTGERLELVSPLPEDMRRILKQ